MRKTVSILYIILTFNEWRTLNLDTLVLLVVWGAWRVCVSSVFSLHTRLYILWWLAYCVSVRSSSSLAAGTFSSTTASQTSRSAFLSILYHANARITIVGYFYTKTTHSLQYISVHGEWFWETVYTQHWTPHNKLLHCYKINNQYVLPRGKHCRLRT